ncbi:MAG TPA: hypothetical protein VMH00_01760 [Candidatus Limnocylindrales bacterium]|nr:hypothetical protein [Candidatus Limnocylindrales bacterium]
MFHNRTSLDLALGARSSIPATPAEQAALVPALLSQKAAVLNHSAISADLLECETDIKLLAPHDKRPARWIRMVESLTVVQLGK